MFKILIIDDEELICWFLKKVLEEEGYEVGVAFDGKEGLMRLEREYFDLIISDIKLPDILGFELIKSIKKINPKTKAIAITALEFQNGEKEALASGASAYVKKPIEPSQLKNLIARILSF